MNPSRARDVLARDVLGPFALMIALAIALMLLFARLAHADPVAAPPPPSTLTDWIGVALMVLLGIDLLVRASAAFLRFLAPRTKTKLDDEWRDRLDRLHDRIDYWEDLLRGATAKPATHTPDARRDPQAGRLRAGLLLTLAATALIVVGVVALLGCTPGQRVGAGQRVSAGLVAALDCEAAHLDAELLADATQLAGATVQRWFGDQSAADDEARAKIKADLAPLKSDLVRCAIAGAVAAVVHRPAQPQGLVTSALSAPGPDPELVRLEIQAAARELGWAPVKAAGSVL